MSYDTARNAAELGEGFPLYRVSGDISANAQGFVSQGGATNIAPETSVESFSQPGSVAGDLLSALAKPLNGLILVLVIIGAIYLITKRKGIPFG